MIREKIVLVLVISVQFFVIANGQSSKAVLQHWILSPELKNAAQAVSVIDPATGQSLLQTEPMVSLTPASILKVVTTATALEVFGPDYRFKTSLVAHGKVANDTLFGDLAIIGGGDPTLGSAYFPESSNFEAGWITVLKQNHIRVITGRVVAVADIYDRLIPGTWVWEDLGNYYGAGACGLSVYDNLYEVHLQSPPQANQPTKVISIRPGIQELELKNEVLSSDINSDQAYIFGNPEDAVRVMRGTIPKGRTDFVVKGSMPDPPAFLTHEFEQKLSGAGIQVKNETHSDKSDQEKKVITETISPALSEIIRLTNHESVNLFAEHLLKHLAWQKNGFGTTKDGTRFVVDFWKEKGIEVAGLFMNDGSGLSRFDAVSAQTMTAILSYMKTRSVYPEVFEQSLPLAGDGTLSVFSSDNFARVGLRVKSGSMTRVRCYAGYLETRSGKTLAFTVMLNNFSCSQSAAIRKIGELLSSLMKEY